MAVVNVHTRRISHRELRNNSSEVLRAVQAGEVIEVTNHGEVAAVLVPPSLTRFERLFRTYCPTPAVPDPRFTNLAVISLTFTFLPHTPPFMPGLYQRQYRTLTLRYEEQAAAPFCHWEMLVVLAGAAASKLLSALALVAALALATAAGAAT